ncbi:membrane protein insertase YidC [Antarcticimicrobium sediminis]|uniref:Membrane protein insertase YidC n=1 Tax=Antarcticimicrobium sediminis TaxID=2546227 RepID=A0A4R5EVV8_9RHOB|nr:membrane protein insertase YidC [Antarcticimicrobium sediminis]TDE39031.1 membrane protein insertase YidC [Antarcticimicrobium sediminis]
MDDQNKNLILATALSFLVILGWFFMFPPPEPEAPGALPAEQASQTAPAAPSADAGPATAGTGQGTAVEEVVADAPRVSIDTPRLSGSISLLGGRIDDLSLKDYHETTEPGSPVVKMLKPVGDTGAYYALYGWAPGAGLSLDDVPGANTEWRVAAGNTLGVDTPVTLAWDNGKGLTFSREIAVDKNYMFTVTQSVENSSGGTVGLAPYGVLARHGEPADRKKFFILHEGVVAMADGELTETDYKKMPDFDYKEREGARADVRQVETDGWIGFTDHYWMSTLIPAPGSAFKQAAKYDERRDIYQTETVLPTETLTNGQSASVTTQLFAGAKEWETIRAYEKAGIKGFIDSIDWGWFFFLTKPIFWLLHNIHNLIGNMGWSIIALTLILKAILFPLAFKSYVSMAKMKELQPQMEKLKEAAGDDRAKVQQGMMELYKKEKVNPAAGCLPILLQIPIFFSLYKVIFVTIELRQTAWFGPFQDLSAPDPTSIMNFFGLAPWGSPEPGTMMATVMIGILPLLLGISMFLQQKLNPAPTDATQKMIFAWMPWVFMFMLGRFASGLVVYWITNNTITFTQQYLIMRSQGYKPDVFGNIKETFQRGAKGDKK